MLQNLIALVAACDDLSDGNADVVAVLSGVRLRRGRWHVRYQITLFSNA